MDDALKRWGWSGKEPAVTTVVTLEPGSGAIKGLRYETQGAGPTISFKAAELWPEVDREDTVKIMVHDLSRLRWQTSGSQRNQTEWMGQTLFNTEATHQVRGKF